MFKEDEFKKIEGEKKRWRRKGVREEKVSGKAPVKTGKE
jgi:hypothetical protein